MRTQNFRSLASLKITLRICYRYQNVVTGLKFDVRDYLWEDKSTQFYLHLVTYSEAL